MRTIGRAYFDKPKKRWDITIEPHAMCDFKRVFPKCDTGQLGTVTLTDSPETARRLAWFSKLWPMDFDPLAYVEARAAEYEAQQTAIERILAADYQPRKYDLAIPLRPYQVVVPELILSGCDAPGRGVLIGDALGLGKTAEAIAALCDPRALPALYVTLTALPPQVQEMIGRFLPGLRTHVVKSGTPYDLTKKPYSRTGKTIPMPDVIIISWSKLHGWAECLAKMKLGLVVFDEAHELRHPDSDRYRAAAHIRASARMCCGLTGTPIFGVGSQIHRVMDVIAPGALGDWGEFCRENADGAGEKPALTDPDAVGRHLREVGLFLRRTRDEVGMALPPIQRITVPVDSEGTALHEVSGRALELARLILEVGGKGEDKMRAGGELDWKLRQATGIGKARHVAEFVRMQLEAGEKVLLYGWHLCVYDVWREQLADFRPAFYTGEESQNEKAASLARFCDPKHDDPTRLLIMSLRSGAGLDGLQYAGCNIVVMGEIDWAAACHEQAEARVDRPGHPGHTLAYYLLSNTGSDPVLAEMLGFKTAQLVGLRDPGTGKAVKAPDQEAIKLRMKRMAADYLNRHDPRALDRIPGARAFLVAADAQVETPPPQVAAPAFRPPTTPPVVTPAATGRPLVIDVPEGPSLPGIGLAAVGEHYAAVRHLAGVGRARATNLPDACHIHPIGGCTCELPPPEEAQIPGMGPFIVRNGATEEARAYQVALPQLGAALPGGLPARRLGNPLPPALAAQALALDLAPKAPPPAATPPPAAPKPEPPRLVLPTPRRLGAPLRR